MDALSGGVPESTAVPFGPGVSVSHAGSKSGEMVALGSELTETA